MHQPNPRRLLRTLGTLVGLSLVASAASAVASAASAVTSAASAQTTTPGSSRPGLLRATRVDATSIVVEASDAAAWRELRIGRGSLTMRSFPLSAQESVDLQLERFFVTSPDTRFVLGLDERALDFDPASVALLRGNAEGYPGSRVFLALSEYGNLGYVDLGQPGMRFDVSSAAASSPGAAAGLRISRSVASGGVSLPVPMCGLDALGDEPGQALSGASPHRRSGDRVLAGAGLATGVKHIELAIETDHELFQLFGNLPATMAYIVSLYAVVSDIYLHDMNAWVELTFVRLWDTPVDLFNEASPIQPFRAYWEKNMAGVQRDVAQFFSGRRDLPYGGVAYLSGLCNDAGYSVCGYALGFFDDSSAPSIGNRDITVTAHELGHNCAAGHTHGYGLDTCDDETSTPRRGTIMSYCGQTFTGGASNTDLRFHTFVQDIVQDFLAQSACIADDCNQNAVADALDIAMATSLDANGNGVPDECEDCNANGTLDPQDIGSGTSADLNGNGIPDECEPDCNANGSPDDLDIELFASMDQNFNLVPDECEPDCDGDGTMDYVQINADMSLDLNRNVVLDACEDCDGDGTTDLVELDHAHNVWVASLDQTTLREYLGRVGPLTDVSDAAGINGAQDLIVTSDRRMLVAAALDHRVLEFDVDGTLIGNLVAPGVGGLTSPAGLAVSSAGTLLVASRGTDEVLEYDAATGAFIGAFVSSGAGGLVQPFGLAFDVEGDLFVTSNDGRVLRFAAATGAYLGEFVSAADNGGLADPHGLLFLPNGNLLVASYATDQILEYAAGTGSFLRQFNQGGTADRLTLDQPWTLRLGPEGNVYVSRAHDHVDPVTRSDSGNGSELHLTNARIYEFDVELGFLVRAYILGVNSGVENPTGFDFVPGRELDCNFNGVPDVCDVAAGHGQDANANGTLDECDINVYCSSKINSAGCRPQIGFQGLPTLSGADDFRITASGVVGSTTGLLLVGLAPNPPGGPGPVFAHGPSPLGGRYCVSFPMIVASQSSAGAPGSCEGAFDFPLSQAFLGSLALPAGSPVYSQVWYRDLAHPDGSEIGHSAGLEFLLLP